MKTPSLEKWAAMCEAKGGNITEMAKGFNVKSRQTIYSWMEKDKEFREVYDNIEESHLDLAESQLHLLIKGIPKIEEVDVDGKMVRKFTGWYERPSEAAIFFKLKTKGKKRGYIEKQEIDHSIKEMPALPSINLVINGDNPTT
jgi:hypothetical protein